MPRQMSPLSPLFTDAPRAARASRAKVTPPQTSARAVTKCGRQLGRNCFESMAGRLHRHDIAVRTEAADHALYRSGKLGMSMQLVACKVVGVLALEDQ